MTNNQQLSIVGVGVRQDSEGRYCLNDLHRAAMAKGTASKSQRPGNFMRRDETAALVEAIKKRCSDPSIAPVSVVRGGAKAGQGTFVSKSLVYAFAMWINPDFHLDVIEAFDEAQNRPQNLWLQMQAHIAREIESQVRASFGSHLMLTRKKEKPLLLTEREQLEAAIQPSLLN